MLGWMNLLGSAAAWFDVFLEGWARFQMRLLLPCAFFEFSLGVELFGARFVFLLVLEGLEFQSEVGGVFSGAFRYQPCQSWMGYWRFLLDGGGDSLGCCAVD